MQRDDGSAKKPEPDVCETARLEDGRQLLGAGEPPDARRQVRVGLPAGQHFAEQRHDAVEPQREEGRERPAAAGGFTAVARPSAGGRLMATVASAFLISPATMGQRLVRAKTKIRQAGIPFRVPDRADLRPRLDAVLEAIYAAFAEGWCDRQIVEIGIGVVRGLVAVAIDRLPKIALPI